MHLRRFTTVLLCLVAAVAFAGCGSDGDKKESKKDKAAATQSDDELSAKDAEAEATAAAEEFFDAFADKDFETQCAMYAEGGDADLVATANAAEIEGATCDDVIEGYAAAAEVALPNYEIEIDDAKANDDGSVLVTLAISSDASDEPSTSTQTWELVDDEWLITAETTG